VRQQCVLRSSLVAWMINKPLCWLDAARSRGEAEVSKRLDSVLDAAATRLDGVKSKLRFFDTAFKSLLRYFGDKKGQPAETFEKVSCSVVCCMCAFVVACSRWTVLVKVALIIDQLRLDVSKYQELKAKETKKAAREARRLAAKNNSSTTRQHKKKKKKHHKHTKPTPSSDSTGADNAPVASEGTSAGVGTGEQKQPADTTEDKQVPHSVADADADEAKDTVGSLPASPSKQRRRSIPFKKVKRKVGALLSAWGWCGVLELHGAYCPCVDLLAAELACAHGRCGERTRWCYRSRLSILFATSIRNPQVKTPGETFSVVHSWWCCHGRDSPGACAAEKQIRWAYPPHIATPTSVHAHGRGVA